MPQDPFTHHARPPQTHFWGSNSSLAANSCRVLAGLTPKHIPCTDSPGPRRLQAAKAPRGYVSSVFEVEGAFQSGNAQPLCGFRRLTPLPMGRWG